MRIILKKSKNNSSFNNILIFDLLYSDSIKPRWISVELKKAMNHQKR